jgi:hypothetical protein
MQRLRAFIAVLKFPETLGNSRLALVPVALVIHPSPINRAFSADRFSQGTAEGTVALTGCRVAGSGYSCRRRPVKLAARL